MCKVLLSLFCCKSSEDDDEQYLVLNHDQDETDRSRPFPQQTQVNQIEPSTTSNGHNPGNRLTPPDSNDDPPKTREQQEKDLLDKILYHAQKSIIDVSHMEKNGPDVDFSQRSKAYSEAIRKRDNKRKNNRDEGFLITDSKEMGLSARNQNIQQDEVSLILNTSEMFSEAIKSDIGIEPTETLIAYISID